MRSFDDIAADRKEQFTIIENARARIAKLDAERREAQFAAAAESDHPWLGKKVKRVIQQRLRHSAWYRGPTKFRELKQRGIVKRQPAERSQHRNYTPSPGEIFVESSSGGTAYPFPSPDGKWELAE